MNTQIHPDDSDEVRALKHTLRSAWAESDVLRRETDRLNNEIAAIRWMVRGIAAERAHFTVSVGAHMERKELLFAAEVFGRNTAMELMQQAKLSYKGHAREYVMRCYIAYLQNHARSRGVSFSELGEDNYGQHDVWAPDWEPAPYHAGEFLKRPMPPKLNIADFVTANAPDAHQENEGK